MIKEARICIDGEEFKEAYYIDARDFLVLYMAAKRWRRLRSIYETHAHNAIMKIYPSQHKYVIVDINNDRFVSEKVYEWKTRDSRMILAPINDDEFFVIFTIVKEKKEKTAEEEVIVARTKTEFIAKTTD